MLVTPHLENSVFQSGGLCSLPLPSPYLHTDISHAIEMHFPHFCTLELWLHALLSPSVRVPLFGSLKLGRHLSPTLEIHKIPAHEMEGEDKAQQKGEQDKDSFVQ